MGRIRSAASFLWAVAIFALSPASARAEGQATGQIVGYVFDQGGVPLSGVKLEATLTGGAAARRTYSSSEGGFVLDALPVGAYALRATGPSLKEVVVHGLLVTAEGDAELIVVMEGPRHEERTVLSCGPPVVDVRNAAGATEVDAGFLSALPLPLRLFPEDLSGYVLSSRPRELTSALGGRRSGLDNGLFVDGFSLSDPVTGGGWLHLPAPLLAAANTEAFAFGADAPDAVGGTLSLITLSGSNHTEGVAQGGHELGRDQRTTRAGLGLFGPVVRDHVWYSLAATVIQARGGAGTPERERRALQAAAKLTWMINARNKLGLTTLVNGDRLDHAQAAPGIPDAQPARARFGARGAGIFTGLSLEDLLTDTLVTRFQIAVGQTRQEIAPAKAGSVPVSPAAWELHRTSRTRSLELGARLEWFADSSGPLQHAVKLELRGRVSNHHTVSHTGWAVPASAGDPDRASRLVDDPETTRSDRLFLDLSDRWKLNRHITVSGGLGWIGSRAGTDRGGTAYAGWAMTPHLGLAWDVTRDGRSVVRASIERRVDTGSLSLAQRAFPGAALESCRRDPTTGAFTSQCDRAQDSPPVLDPTTTLPRGVEFALGVEREVARRTALSLDVVHRRLGEGWRPRLDLPGEPGSPGAPRPPSSPLPALRHSSVTTTITRREGRLKLLGGYTFSRDRVSTTAPTDVTAHTLRLHAVAEVGANISLGALYHFSAGAAAEDLAFLARPMPAHEAGLRLKHALRLSADRSLSLFADAMAGAGRRTAEPLDAGLPSQPPPFRAAFGVEATY